MQPGSSRHFGVRPTRAGWIAPRCVVCALVPGSPLCEGCERDFFAPDAPRCERCAIRLGSASTGWCGQCLAQPPHFDATATLADYVAPVSGMIAALKFSARLDLAEAFARLLAAPRARACDRSHRGSALVVRTRKHARLQSVTGNRAPLRTAHWCHDGRAHVAEGATYAAAAVTGSRCSATQRPWSVRRFRRRARSPTHRASTM